MQELSRTVGEKKWSEYLTRNFLFRGKLKDNEEWVKGHLGIEVGNQLVIEYCDFDDILDEYCVKERFIIPETVGQYTGLCDKNGTKIFENDILSAHPDELFPDDEIRLIVEWHDYGWFGKDSKGRYTSLESKWVSELFEVIGNRFDKPELLEGKENE